jgi:Protein of unknown function (DUF2785)
MQDLRGYDTKKGWMRAIAHAADFLWVLAQHRDVGAMDVVRSEAETCARHNTKYFLCSLYCQLRSPGFAHMTFVEQRPAVADALLPLVENALSQIRAWC